MAIEAGKKAYIKRDSGEDPRILGAMGTVFAYVENMQKVWLTLDTPIDGVTSVKVSYRSLGSMTQPTVRRGRGGRIIEAGRSWKLK